MANLVQCKSCSGVYAPIQADGSSYFHVCPPLSEAEVAAAVAAGKLVLPGAETPSIAVQKRTYERTQKRDESPVPNANPKLAATMKAAGKGTIDLGKVAAASDPVPVDV